MASVALIAGDTLPTRLTYKTAKGAIIDITGYTFSLHIGYPEPLVKAAAVADGPNGVLEIPWAEGDLQAGTWPFEIVVTVEGKSKTHKLGEMVIASRLA